MTSEEIRKHMAIKNLTHEAEAQWEIAYQLAVMNERESPVKSLCWKCPSCGLRVESALPRERVKCNCQTWMEAV